MGKEMNNSTFSFKQFAQEKCNGCDLITSEDNKLSTEDIVDYCAKKGNLTIHDFAQVEIEDELVGVVTFDEMPEKYYWGGKAITDMVNNLIEIFGGEKSARAAYAAATNDSIQIKAEKTKTKNNRDFTKITVM